MSLTPWNTPILKSLTHTSGHYRQAFGLAPAPVDIETPKQITVRDCELIGMRVPCCFSCMQRDYSSSSKIGTQTARFL